MSLLDRLRKNSTVKETSILSNSKFFSEKDMITTSVPIINVALSGKLDGGLTPGLTLFAGESKSGKTLFLLLCIKAYLDKYPEAVCLFYDSEFGSPQSYFDAFGIDTSRVIHTPLTDIEQLKFDVMKQLSEITKGDHVFIAVDSFGNLASKKEVDDALNEKSVADMSRSKQMKSFFRMVTPHLTIKDIPMVGIQHTYKSMSLFPTDVVSGGSGGIYASDNIIIISKSQEKDGSELAGFSFNMKIEKSRYVKEKSKLSVRILFDKGIVRWSGLLDIALEGGYVIKPSNGWYCRVISGKAEDKKYRAKETDTKDFWSIFLNDKTFQKYVSDKYSIAVGSIIDDANDLENHLDEDIEIDEEDF